MAYTRINWQNGITPIDDTNLNKMDKGIKDLDDGKQNLLSSGTNIKTINGQSVLGSGNIYTSGYSSTEKVIGTWKNGKPLYEITVDFTTPNNTTLSSMVSLSSECKIQKFDGYVDISSSIRVPLNFRYDNDNFVIAYPLSNTLYAQVGTEYKNKPGDVTLQYTKSTD